MLQSIRQGESLVMQGRPAEALIAFDNALHFDVRCFEAVHGKGVALARCGDIIQARDCLLRAFEIDPGRIPLATYHYFLDILCATKPDSVKAVLQKARSLFRADPKLEQVALWSALADYDLVEWEHLYTQLNPFDSVSEASNSIHVRLKPRHMIWRVRREELNLRYYIGMVVSKSSQPEDLKRYLNHLIDAKRFKDVLTYASSNIGDQSGLNLMVFGLVQYYFGRISGRRELQESALQAFATVLNVRPTGLAAYFVGLVGSELGVAGVNAEECFRYAIALDDSLAEPHYELGTRLQAKGEDMASIPDINAFTRKRESQINSTPLGRSGIRFITETNSYAFGHMTDLPRVFVMARELGLLPNYKIIWLAPEGWVANYALLDCWKKHFEIVTDHAEIAKFGVAARELELDTSFFTLPNGSSVHTRIAVSYMNREWKKRGYPPIIRLSADVEQRGAECLKKLGVVEGKWIVALHVRAAGFKGDSKVGGFNGHRLADERTYGEAVRYIRQRGGEVIRLGEEPAPLELRGEVIDYAVSPHKSDWMDLYILSKAKFVLGSSSGLTPGAGLFGTPVVATNFCPTPYRNEEGSIVIPKLIWSEKQQRLATFQEWFQPPIFEMENGALLGQMGYKFIDNTPEEIREAVEEMLDVLDGRLKYTTEEDSLQERFKSLEPIECGRAYLARLPRRYLERNKNLF